MKKLIFFFFILFQNVFSQTQSLSEQATISVFTCGSGEELYTTFGHTAIRIKDVQNNLDVVYNYGAFDFRTENFYLKFVKGDLQYFIVANSYPDFIIEYQYFNREVIEQTLKLSQTQKQQLFEVLNASLQSEDRYYTYKFIDRNCTTMVVEKINAILEKPIIQKVDDKTISYRSVLFPYFKNHFWYNLGISIIFGEKVDRKAEKIFLPVEFMHSLDQSKIVAKKETIVTGSTIKSEYSFFNNIDFIYLIFIIILIINNQKLNTVYLFIAGLLGLFFCFIGLYTQHQEALWNYNALLFNPLFLVLPFIKNKKIVYACLGMLIIYSVIIFNKPHLGLMIPFIFSHAFMLKKIIDHDKKAQY